MYAIRFREKLCIGQNAIDTFLSDCAEALDVADVTDLQNCKIKEMSSPGRAVLRISTVHLVVHAVVDRTANAVHIFQLSVHNEAAQRVRDKGLFAYLLRKHD